MKIKLGVECKNMTDDYMKNLNLNLSSQNVLSPPVYIRYGYTRLCFYIHLSGADYTRPKGLLLSYMGKFQTFYDFSYLCIFERVHQNNDMFRLQKF